MQYRDSYNTLSLQMSATVIFIFVFYFVFVILYIYIVVCHGYYVLRPTDEQRSNKFYDMTRYSNMLYKYAAVSR